PPGCALPADLAARGIATVVDAGLRPRDVMHANTQVIEGAPARVSDAAVQGLEDDEVAWLRSGRRVELAVKAPHAVFELLAAALAEKREQPSGAAAAASD